MIRVCSDHSKIVCHPDVTGTGRAQVTLRVRKRTSCHAPAPDPPDPQDQSELRCRDHQAGRRLQRAKATEAAADPASAWRSGTPRRRSKTGSMAPAHGPNQLAMPDAIGDARQPRIYRPVHDAG
jgi:hypothetical protein